MDKFSREQRHNNMAAVKSKNTKPELIVRKILYRNGFRYRLHRRDLPGKPDIVLPKYKTVIFIHGCFWHQHPGCPKSKLPATHESFWREKLQHNVNRDRNQHEELAAMGWHVEVLWECEVMRCARSMQLPGDFMNRLRNTLSPSAKPKCRTKTK